MTFIDESKSILENIYFICQPLFLIVAIMGLRQLKITKDSIRITSRRESAIMAFNLSNEYFNEILEIVNIIAQKMADNDIDPEQILNLNLSDLSVIDDNTKKLPEFKKFEEKHDLFHADIYKIAIKLETFSIPFIQEIADESLAYKQIFLPYYQFCNLCALEIENARKKIPHEKALYENTIKLYAIWKQRNNNEQIDHQVASLLRNKKTVQSIIPIGTK